MKTNPLTLLFPLVVEGLRKVIWGLIGNIWIDMKKVFYSLMTKGFVRFVGYVLYSAAVILGTFFFICVAYAI